MRDWPDLGPCGEQFPSAWPVQYKRMDWVSQALEQRSREVSVSTAKIIRGGCASAMFAGYKIQDDGPSST